MYEQVRVYFFFPARCIAVRRALSICHTVHLECRVPGTVVVVVEDMSRCTRDAFVHRTPMHAVSERRQSLH